MEPVAPFPKLSDNDYLELKQVDGDTQRPHELVHIDFMGRTNVDLDDRLIRRARRLIGLKTKKAVVHRAHENLVRAEGRKGISESFGSSVRQGRPTQKLDS